MKKGIISLLGVSLLAVGGFLPACGGDDGATELTTEPTQTAEAQAAAAQAIAMAQMAQALALGIMGGSTAVLSPANPSIQPLAKELELANPNWCPSAFYIDIAPDGCDLAVPGSCESIEIWTDYAEGCTEKGVYKSGDAMLKLEALDYDGFKVTAAFNDFVEGALPIKDGSWSFSAAPSEDKNSGEMKIETGDSGYSEGDETIEGYALLDFEADGPVAGGGGTGDPATEATLTVEADIEATGGADDESINAKWIVASDMTEDPGNPNLGTVTIDISGTSSDWGKLQSDDEMLEWKADALTLSPDCNDPVGGSISVRYTDDDVVEFDATLTFHEACDGQADITITVNDGETSGTFTGTISLTLVAPPEDTILEELLNQFDQTLGDITAGLEELD